MIRNRLLIWFNEIDLASIEKFLPPAVKSGPIVQVNQCTTRPDLTFGAESLKFLVQFVQFGVELCLVHFDSFWPLRVKVKRRKTYFNCVMLFDLYSHSLHVNSSFEWFSEMCFFSRKSVPQEKSHILHFINLSCTILMCCLKSAIKAYALGHCGHWSVFSPWTRFSWHESWFFVLNVFGQKEHFPVNSITSITWSTIFSFDTFLRFFAVGGLSLDR